MEKENYHEQRHLQWLEYYNQVREEYKAKSPELYKMATREFFVDMVAEKFNHSPGYVNVVLYRLAKKSSEKK